MNDNSSRASKELIEQLSSELIYEAETGNFRWRKNKSNIKEGDIAGSFCSKGYLRITINGKRYAAHRLAWLFYYGEWPSQVDHKDGVRHNNRIENLRECTISENHQNRIGLPGSSKYVGVSWKRSAKKWQASIMLEKKSRHLGYFLDEESAHKAYLAAKAELHTFQPRPRNSNQEPTHAQ